MFSETPTSLLLVGPLTSDLRDGQAVPGGAVAYGARAAAALGVEAHALTVAARDASLEALAEADACVIPAASMLTFEHRHVRGGRELRLLAWPDHRLAASDLPLEWRAPDTLVLAPLLPDDLVLLSFLALPAKHVVLLAQGLQRRLAPGGLVEHESGPTDALLRALSPRTSVFFAADELDRWPPSALEEVARRTARLVVTRGAHGADIYRGGSLLHIPAAPAPALDSTGAGDVFAVAYAIALAEGMDDADAGALASVLAAAAVEREGAARLPERAALEERVRDVRSRVNELAHA